MDCLTPAPTPAPAPAHTPILAPEFELGHLLESIADPNVEFTHVSGDTQWAIPAKNQELFWFGYCDFVQQGVEVCLYERVSELVPLRVTIQCKPTMHDLQQICRAYQDAIAEFYVVNPTTHLEQLVVVMEGEHVTLQFPYARIANQAQIRARVIEILQEQLPTMDWLNTISEHRSSVMYGHSKLGPVTRIWSYIDDPAPAEVPLSDAFVPRNHAQCQQGHIQGSFLDLKDHQFWLPMFLSTEYWPYPLPARTIAHSSQ